MPNPRAPPCLSLFQLCNIFFNLDAVLVPEISRNLMCSWQSYWSSSNLIWAQSWEPCVAKLAKVNLLILCSSNRNGHFGCGSPLWIHWRQSLDMSLSWFFSWNCSRGARQCTFQALWTYCTIPSPSSCHLPRSMCCSDCMRRSKWN